MHLGGRISLLVVLASAICLGACSPGDQTASGGAAWRSTTILVSLDGFRWDYRNRFAAPALDRLAASGVAANLRPPFPSKTFTSHYTIATGLYPNHHGIVGNTMYDPQMDARFSMGDADAVADGRWWGGEPIWVTVEKAGLVAAACFWPGTEAEIEGVRPTYWRPYDGSFPGNDRVDLVLGWLGLPQDQRPSLITLYFSEVDDAGHRYGPLSDETGAAVAKVDGYMGRLIAGIDSLGLEDSVNFVIVSDHGMSQLSPDRVVYIDDYVDVDRAGPLSLGQYVALWPQAANEAAIFDKLDGAHHALTVYQRGSIPERFHLDGHRRTPPIVGVVEDGWSVSTRPWVEKRQNPFSGGGHGYDNQVPDMAGIFIAAGPAFRRGVALPLLDGVDVYNVLVAAIGLTGAKNDGNVDAVAGIVEPTKN